MNLNDYGRQIEEIMASELPDTEKQLALEMTADALASELWQLHAKARARELSTRARTAASKYPYGGLEAMDALAARGLLVAK